MTRKFLIEFGRAPDHSLDYFLGILNDARLTTLQRVEKLSFQELDWQYRPGWNTIGALLSHITALEHYFRIEFIEGRKLTEEENARWLPGLDMGEYLPQLMAGEPLEKYLADLAESRELMTGAMKNVDFARFSARREEYDPAEGCNLAWVLFHMIEDEIYHRGQISIIQKLFKAANS